MKNKRGMSAVITTVLLVALVIVAVGIVWAIVSGVIGGATDEVNLASDCLKITITPMAMDCSEESSPLDGSSYNCDVTLKRGGTSEKEIAGVAMTFTSTGESKTVYKSGNIPNLDTESKSVDKGALGFNVAPIQVEVSAYFVKSDGEKYVCPNKKSLISK